MPSLRTDPWKETQTNKKTKTEIKINRHYQINKYRHTKIDKKNTKKTQRIDDKHEYIKANKNKPK